MASIQSINCSTNLTNVSSISCHEKPLNKATFNEIALKVVFGTIAVASFVGNGVLCAIMLRKKKMLRKNYNVLIFNLAIADTLTGIFIAATPDYLFSRRSYPFPETLGGEIYCRLVGSTYILFIFGKASNLTIMFLAIDRWYSIVRPIVYKTKFSKTRLYWYIVLIWVISCVTQVNELFITFVQKGLCTFKTPFYGKKVERILILTHVTLTFYIPSIITWCSFAHIMVHMRKAVFRRSHNNLKATNRLLRMCALAALFLSICWLPTETFFVVFKFDVYTLPFTGSLTLGVLAMFNSCLNPLIYCLSNKEYRREFVGLLCCSEANHSWCLTLPTRASSSQSQYSFTNVISLSTNVNPNNTDRNPSITTRSRDSIFSMDQLESSKATLKRHSSFQELGFENENYNHS